MTKGLDQILSRLNELQVKAPKAARAAVGEGADEVEKILKVNTPVYFVLDGVHAKETIAYKLLSNNEELNSLLDKLRGKKFGLGFKQGIFTYDIPERPTNALSKELAPFMRIYPTYENDVEFADDKAISTEHRITINYWCLNAKQSEQIAELMDKILESNDFERYTTNELPRYRDNDIDLLVNVRKYRFFDWQLEKLRNED